MKYKILIPALLCVLSESLSAQTLFHKYVNDPQTTWYRAHSDNDETLLIGNDNTHIKYLKLDKNADTIWSERFDNSGYFSTAIAIPITGSRLNYISLTNTNVYQSATNDFAYQWTKSYDYDASIFSPTTSQLLFGKHFSNGDIIMAGETTVDIFSGQGYIIYPMLTLTDSAGNILWSKQYEIGRCFETEMIADRGNELVVVGLSYTTYPVTSMPVWTVMIINKSDGEPIDEAKSILVNGYLNVNTLCDDGSYMAGYYLDASQSGYGSAAVMKIMSNGNLEWIKSVSSETHPHGLIGYLKRVGNNEIYFDGEVAIDVPYPNPQFFAARTSDDFASVDWSMAYTDTTLNGAYVDSGRARLIVQASDSTLILWGWYNTLLQPGYAIKINKDNGMTSCKNYPLNTSFSNITFTSDSFIVSTNSPVLTNPQSATFVNPVPAAYNPFSVDTICTTPDIVNNTVIVCKFFPETVFPNPAVNEINIFTEQFDNSTKSIFYLYDLNGRIVKQIELTNVTSRLNVNDVVSGIYNWKLISKEGVSNGKIILINN